MHHIINVFIGLSIVCYLVIIQVQMTQSTESPSFKLHSRLLTSEVLSQSFLDEKMKQALRKLISNNLDSKLINETILTAANYRK